MKQKHLFLSFLLSMFCLFMNGQINMSSSTATVVAATPFFDSGGAGTNYGNNENFTQVITTTIPDHRVKVAFSSFITSNVSDSLSIYNGPTALPANFVNKYSGSIFISTQYSTGNSMTFRFVSDAISNAAGWQATATPFGIASITQTTTSQSSTIIFDILGSNTDWSAGIQGIFLVHSVSGTTLAVSSYSPVNNTQMQATFNIPCNADLGLYNLRIEQPGSLGATTMSNAFNVTPYDVNITGTNLLCAFAGNGVITSTVTGGSGPYSYNYAPGSYTTAAASGLAAGTYTLDVQDVNGCARTKTITITQPPVLSNGSPPSQTICSGQSAVLTMTASGGTGGYTYTWNGPNLSSNTTASTIASPLSSNTYTYSVMDANACTKASTLIITVNPLPSIVTSANPPNVCVGATSTVTASGSAISYTWNTGATTASASVSPVATTVYTVTGTGSNSCANTQTVNVTVDPLPVVSFTTSSPLCAGGVLNFINTTTGGGIYSWSGPSSYASTATNPSINPVSVSQSGTYTLSAINAATGCSASTTRLVTVNNVPAIAVTSATQVCAGSSFTVNNSGAVTYTWMPGGTTGVTQTITPVASTNYTVSGTDVNGCTGSLPIFIAVNALTAISGSASVSSNPVAGKVTLYEYEPFLTKFDSVTTQTLSGAGAYTFTSIPAGSYIVKAIPSASTLQVTYGNSAISWQGATVMTHSCISSSVQNISVVPFATVTPGPGSLSGTITQTVGFGQRPSSILSPLAPGQPIGGIVVKGGRNPGGSMFQQTTTGADGTYTLTGLPNGNYFVLVDIPGLDTNGTYHPVISISDGQTLYTGLDFTVDSIRVNPVPSTATSIKNAGTALENISVYPNPATNQVSIRYSLQNSALVSIELMDVIGQTLKPVLVSTRQEAGIYNTHVTLSDLKPGMYFIKVKTDRNEQVIRLVITD